MCGVCYFCTAASTGHQGDALDFICALAVTGLVLLNWIYLAARFGCDPVAGLRGFKLDRARQQVTTGSREATLQLAIATVAYFVGFLLLHVTALPALVPVVVDWPQQFRLVVAVEARCWDVIRNFDCIVLLLQRRFLQRSDRVKGVDLHPTEPW